MKRIINKKTIIIAILCMIIFVLFIIHRERLAISFRDSTSLNFLRDDITYISITSRGMSPIDFHNVVINDPEKIKEIIDLLNSLELVEAELPRNLLRQINNLEDVGWVFLYIGESPSHNPGDYVSFYTNYMTFTYHGHEAAGHYSYYVRNSDFCRRTRSSNVYQFLYELINEYVSTGTSDY